MGKKDGATIKGKKTWKPFLITQQTIAYKMFRKGEYSKGGGGLLHSRVYGVRGGN